MAQQTQTSPKKTEKLVNGLPELQCDTCRKQSLTQIATKFCEQCRQNLCEKCVGIHGYFSAMASHRLVNIDDGHVRKSTETDESEPELADLPVERCPKHPEKVIDMFCKYHEVVACSLCFLAHFKLCGEIHYVPDVADKMVDDAGVDKMATDMHASATNIDDVVTLCRAVLGELKTSKDTAVGTIREFRKHLNAILDDLEKKTLQDVENKHGDLVILLETEIAKALKLKEKATDRLKDLHVPDVNKSRLFVSQTFGKQLINESESLVKAVTKTAGKARLYYKNDSTLSSYLTSQSGLGVIRDQKFKFCQVKGKQKYEIKLEDDEQCNVWGSCITGQGNILLADNGNNKLKLLDKFTYKVIDRCSLPASPRSLFRVNDKEIAVSLSNKCIYFVSTDPDLCVERYIQVDHNCFGLACTDNLMYISDGSQNVHVYTMDGESVRTIIQDQSGENIFSECRDITVSDDGSRIHVADSRKGVVTLNKEGRVLWKHTGSELKGAYGVCTDGGGNLLVTGLLSHNVVHLGRNGEKLGEVIKASDDVSSPVSVCFDGHNERVLVTKIGNYVYAFDFE